jgi:hypothetical protein
MAIPGVTPTAQLLSLTDQDDDGSIGAVLGSGSAAEAAYRASLSGQRAPIFGKGGVQFASFAPYNTIFSLTDDENQNPPITNPDNLPVQDGDDGFNPSLPSVTGPSGTFTSAQNTTQYGPVTSFVQDTIGNANINVPFVGDVNVPNTAVNTVIDTVGDFGVPGLGVLSTLVNPTMVETSWGTPFNTGGGGLIGVAGQLSLNNLENIYGETQAGTEGYDFYAPGDLPGTSTPIGLSPGLFGFGTVVSGNTDMMPPQADLNNDGTISATEVAAFADPNSPGAQAFQEIEDNKIAANQFMQDYISQQQAAGGSAYTGGSVVTDSQGNPVTSPDPVTGEPRPVTSGGTFTNFGSLPSEEETSTTTESTGNIFSGIGDFFSGVFGSDPEPEPEVSTSTGDITSQGIMDAITSGMENASSNPRPEGTFELASSNITTTDASSDDDGPSGGGFSVGYGEGQVDPGLAAAASSPSTSAATNNDKDGDTSSSNDNDSDGDGKIVCTEMYRQTQLDDWAKAMKVWDVYQKKHLTKFHEIGYHWLFKPYVKGMRKSNSMTKLGAYLAKERTQHLKHVLTKGRAKDSIVGNIWCKIIHPVVYVAGKIKKES